MNTLKTIGRFIFKSSADPRNMSLTVKSLLLGLIPFIMQTYGLVCTLGLSCHGFDATLLETIADLAGQLVYYGLSFIAVAGSIYGLVRKIVLTMEGNNRSLQ